MKFVPEKALLIVLCLLWFQGLIAQTDTLFWFAAPEVANSHADRPVYLRLSTLGQPSKVTLSIPANSSFSPLMANMPGNSSLSIDLTPYIDMIENQPADMVLNKGIRIQATNSITAYYEVYTACLCNPEIFALKGQNALGTEFYTPFQNYLNNRADAISSFDIVATENNTTISITPSENMVGHPANIPFTIVLNKGQTYSAVASSTLASKHLGGTHVLSDKPIAITVKDDSLVLNTCQDLVGDQIVPVNRIGKKYIVIKGFLTLNDRVFIMAIQDNTQIFINGGGSPVATIGKAETFAYALSQPTLYIEASGPVYVLHLSGFGCETGMPLLPSIECTGSSQISFTRSTDEFFGLIILTKQNNQQYFSINGNNSLIPASSFSPVPGTANSWVYSSLSFTTAQIITGSGNTISNSKGVFHLGIINGFDAKGCRYGYFSAYNTYSPIIQSDNYCANNLTHFNLSDTSMLLSVKWNFDDVISGPGNNSGLNDPGHLFENSGSYHVQAIVEYECGIDTLYQPVTIKPSPVIQLGNDTTLCSGSTIQLDAGALFNNYLWNTGDITRTISVSAAGKYSVSITNNNNCTNSDTIFIDSATNPSITAIDTLIAGQITINATSGTQPFYYAINSSDFQTSPTFTGLASGRYLISVRDANHCLVTTSILLNEHDLEIPNFFTPNDDGVHDTWEIKGLGAYPDAVIQLFDRFGKSLITYKGTEKGWNGYYSGKPCKSDDYWYIITISDKRMLKGHVTLKR